MVTNFVVDLEGFRVSLYITDNALRPGDFCTKIALAFAIIV